VWRRRCAQSNKGDGAGAGKGVQRSHNPVSSNGIADEGGGERSCWVEERRVRLEGEKEGGEEGEEDGEEEGKKEKDRRRRGRKQ
jgi:hypothetical protein